MSLIQQLTRHKSIEQLQAELGGRKDFRRVLGLWQLTAIGLGGIIGVGIFVLAGQQAAANAGPAVALSFIIAGIASAAAALCYAEFAGLIPVTGSAYTYGYAVLGEGVAWLIGWDLLLEYALIVAAVASGWSGYVLNLLDAIGLHLPDALRGAPDSGAGHQFNLIAAVVAMAVAGAERALRPRRQLHAGRRQQHLHIARPADRNDGDDERVFEQQIPADDPGGEFAEHRVAVGIRAAGDGNHAGELGVAQCRRRAADTGDQERQRDRRPGIRCRLLAGEHEDADADDAADADRAARPVGQVDTRRVEQ